MELIQPFDVDEGELAGATPEQAFVLGVEWQMVSAQLDAGEPFVQPIHAANASRLKRMCIRRARRFRVEETAAAEWAMLHVADAIGNFPREQGG